MRNETLTSRVEFSERRARAARGRCHVPGRPWEDRNDVAAAKGAAERAERRSQ